MSCDGVFRIITFGRHGKKVEKSIVKIENKRLDFAQFRTAIGANTADTIYFEDENVVGAVFIHSTVNDLLENWEKFQDRFLGANSRAIRSDPIKAWNIYTVHVTEDHGNPSQNADAFILTERKGVRSLYGLVGSCYTAVMPRPPRADEAFGIYHVLNRGNLRATIFHKDEDYLAFERILGEGLDKYQVELLCYQLMPNHYHLILRPLVDGELSRFMKWVGGTHTMRYHAHYHTGGLGHVYQQRFKSFPIQSNEHFLVACRYVERNALRAGLVDRAEAWRWGSLWRWIQKPETKPELLSAWPIARLPNWIQRVNEALNAKELEAIRRCANRGQPFGDPDWTASMAERLELESTMRPRGRPRNPTKETARIAKETCPLFFSPFLLSS